jgi:hypothetical protein
MRQALVAYPNLYKLSADPLDKHLPHNGGLRPFRDHAVTLAQEQATRQLQELQRDIPNIHPEEAKARKSHIMQLLRRIARGRPTHLQAIRTADGSISVDPQVMANTLKDHWSGLSSARHMRETLFKNGFRKISPLMRALCPNRLFLPMIMIAGWSQKRTSSLPLVALRIHPRDLMAFLF